MNIIDSITFKAAGVLKQQTTENDLSLINKYTLRELTAEEVFTFKIAVCDNKIDRDFEVFPIASLNELAKLFVGKTIISNHQHRAENQCARIYNTTVEKLQETTTTGEVYSRLIAYCYMVRTDSTKDLITEIEAGIKKEVSVGCMVDKMICSICGTDNRKAYCKHWAGREYDGQKCYFKLESPTDAYEVSFVAVPAQPNAGTTKSYTEEKAEHEKTFAVEAKIKQAEILNFIQMEELANE